MPISAHLLRKLQESFGADAAADFATVVDNLDALRADIAELRHEMRVEFAQLRSDIAGRATKSELAELRHELAVVVTRMNDLVTAADLKDALWTQTRWQLAGIITILLAILFKA